MATRTKPLSFRASCPHCRSDDDLMIALTNIEEVHCGSCSESFTPDEAVAMLAEQLEKWTKVARWIKAGRAILDGAE
jgi:Zn ribbon nucleic-acid-binding protein